MANAENAKIQIELGQELTTYTAATDSGDHQVYNAGTLWSGKSGFEPSVRPNGMVSGRNVLSSASTVDQVNIAAFTGYSKGALNSVTATNATFSRPTTGGAAKVTSVTMASDGSIVTVSGTENAAGFASTRGSDGGPALIPTNSVEVGQIRVSSSTSAVLATSEIYQVAGQHTERYDYPTWDEYNIGYGIQADTPAEETAHVKFASAIPQIHSNSITKQIYIQYYTPIFSDLSRAMDFVPIEESYSVSSTQIYGGRSVGSSSKSLSQGSHTAMLSDGVSDALVQQKGEKLTRKFFPDQNQTPYILDQGKLGIARTFPVNDQIQADCTISGETQSSEFTS